MCVYARVCVYACVCVCVCMCVGVYVCVYVHVYISVFVNSNVKYVCMVFPNIQTLLAYTTIGTISLFIAFSVLAAVAALLLPIETRGRAMKVNSYCQYSNVCILSFSSLGLWWMM